MRRVVFCVLYNLLYFAICEYTERILQKHLVRYTGRCRLPISGHAHCGIRRLFRCVRHSGWSRQSSGMIFDFVLLAMSAPVRLLKATTDAMIELWPLFLSTIAAHFPESSCDAPESTVQFFFSLSTTVRLFRSVSLSLSVWPSSLTVEIVKGARLSYPNPSSLKGHSSVNLRCPP